MKSMFSLTCGAVLISSAPALAQWVFQDNESAFGEDSIKILVTAAQDYGLGLRCQSDSLEVIFMTPDRSLKNEDYDNLNTPGLTKLLIRVDKNEVVEAFPKLMPSNDGTLTAIAPVPNSLAKQVQDAKGGVSAAIRMIGQTYHEVKFNARGTTAGAKKLIEACGLTLDDGTEPEPLKPAQ